MSEVEQKQHKKVEYNIVEENGRKVYVIKYKTAFRVVDNLLETDYLRSVIDQVLKEDGVHNPNLTRGFLVSDRRGLKKKLAREGIMVDLVLNRFLEEEIPHEQYLFLQQYVGSLVLNEKGADSMNLKIKRGVNEEYFRKKGVKLAEMNEGSIWKLHSVTDIIYGYCSLGHEIRYAFTAVNNFGEKLVFGNTCIHDFFDIDAQLAERLQDHVMKIKAITDEYYNDYHAYYEVHKRLDEFMLILMMYINKINTVLFSKSEISYVTKFIEYGLPVPRPLARSVGIKIHTFLNRAYGGIFYTEKYSVIRNFIYMLHCFAQGSHGYVKEEINSSFPINFLGDRIMPKEIEQIKPLLDETPFASFTVSNFVDKMAFNLKTDQLVTLLSNLYQLNQLTTKFRNDNDLYLREINRATIKLYHKGTGLVLSDDNQIMSDMFNLPNVNDIESYFLNNSLSLKYDKSKLLGVETGYIGHVKGLKREALSSLNMEEKPKQLAEFIKRNPSRVKAEDIIQIILHANYVKSSDEDSMKWFYQVLKGNGIIDEFKSFIRGTEQSSNYKELFEKAKKNKQALDENGLSFAFKILDTVANRGTCTPKQKAHIDKIESFLNGIETQSSDEEENEYEKLLGVVKKNMDKVRKHRLEFAVNILETASKTGKATDKQLTYINKLRHVVLNL